MVDRIAAQTGGVPAVSSQGAALQTSGRSAGADFKQILETGLKLSKHVAERVDRRQLDLSGDRMKLIEKAVDKAAAKGASESLVLLDDLALVVSVKNRTVITAMNRGNMKEGVFTHIDSAIVI